MVNVQRYVFPPQQLKEMGFAILVGGKEGEDARSGEVITEFLSEEEALQVAERCQRMLIWP